MHWPVIISLLLAAAHARDLHEARVFIRELASPKNLHSRSLSEDDGHPDVMALSINTDDDNQLTNFLLARNRPAENSFPIVAANGEFETIQPGELKGPALYLDTRLGGVFAAITDEQGEHEFEGSFNHDGARYHMSKESTEESLKRGMPSGERAYVLRRLSSASFDGDETDNELLDDRDDDMMFVNERRINKRGSNDYNIELGIFLDYSVYSYWLQKKGSQSAALAAINYKFSYTISGMQMAYRSIVKSREGFSLTPWITKLVVNMNFNDSPLRQIAPSLTANDPKTQGIGASDLLDGIWPESKWRKDVGLYAGEEDQQIDAMMFWSGYDLLTDDGQDYMRGQAQTRSACTSRSVSVVEELGFETWLVAAHELGHMMGARHDASSKYGTTACPENDQWLMSRGTNILKGPPANNNHFTFSSCSIKSIREYIDQLNDSKYSENCLNNGGRNGFTVVPVNPEPGKVYSLDEQCSMLFGQNVGQCEGSNQQDRMCYSGLKCNAPGYGCNKSRYRPADGTPCGFDGKSCFHGYCQ